MSSNSILAPITLSEKDRLRGYENYASWKLLMEAHGKPKGLHKYWGGMITVPNEYKILHQVSDDDENAPQKENDSPTTQKHIPPTTPSTAPTPLHSTTPNTLEYELRESVAMSLILINVVDIHGTGIDPDKSSSYAWKHLHDVYGRTSDRARNLREEELAACKLAKGGKVSGEDGHIERMRMLRQRANEAGAMITNSRFITKLLDSFPESWDPIITPMYGETDLNKVIMNLTTHAERLSIRDSRSKGTIKSSDAVRALEATVLALKAEVSNLRGKGPKNPNLKCTNTNCGRSGHLIAT